MARRARPTRDSLNPEFIHQIMYSFAPSRVLFAAVRLAMFSAIAAGKHTAGQIARKTKCDERGTRMLLDALVACKLLNKKIGERSTEYHLTKLAAKFLIPQSPDYIGDMIEHDTMWAAWHHLPASVQSGQPVQRVNDEAVRVHFFPALVRSLHIITREPARRTAQILLAGRRRKGLRVLDVACGSGVWGIAIAEQYQEARVTAQDFESTLCETRTYVERHGLSGRFDYLPGDMNQVDFGCGKYDVVVLGHILHIEGEKSSRSLLKRVSRALRPGGRVIIAEMVPNDRRTGPQFPVFFALNMLLNTAIGDTYSLSEYRQWLKSAGMSDVQSVEAGSHSPVIIATKSGR